VGTAVPGRCRQLLSRAGSVDVDDTVIEVHGHHKQGAGFGYTKVRGLNTLPGHNDHRRGRAADRGAAAASRGVFLTPGREASGR
jgi:hypothetical protein